MADSVFSFDTKTPTGRTTKRPDVSATAAIGAEIEDIARKTGVPVNVLLASVERAGPSLDPMQVAKVTARRVKTHIDSGMDAEAATRAYAGPQADQFLARAKEIGSILYPEAEAPPPPTSGDAQPGLIGDLGRRVAGGVVRSGGDMFEMAGRALTPPLVEGDLDPETGDLKATMRTDPRIAEIVEVADRWRGAGERISDTVSDRSKEAIAGNNMSGNIFKPSTWDMGDNPSMRGFSMLAADVLGSLVPVVATAVATRGATLPSLVTGGLQGGGAAASEAREIVEHAAQDGTLARESVYYQDLIKQGKSQEEALELTMEAAANIASGFTLPVSMFGGLATAKILHGGASRVIGNKLHGTIGGRVATGVAASAVEEGLQEVGEGVTMRAGTQVATGLDQDLLEGSFAEFVLGAVGGASMGGLAGRPDHRPTDDPDDPNGAASLAPSPAAPDPDQQLPAGPEAGGGGVAADPTGPLSRAAAAAPNAPARSITGVAPGARITIASEGATPYAGVFLGETRDGISVKPDGGERVLLPHDAYRAGEFQITPVRPDAQPEAQPGPTPAQRPDAARGFAFEFGEIPPPGEGDTAGNREQRITATVDVAISEIGASLMPSERASVVEALNQYGGDPLTVIEDTIVRSYLNDPEDAAAPPAAQDRRSGAGDVGGRFQERGILPEAPGQSIADTGRAQEDQGTAAGARAATVDTGLPAPTDADVIAGEFYSAPEDGGEPQRVSVTPEGPWDFNDTWPSPDVMKVAMHRRDGSAGSVPFETGSAEEVVGTLTETLNAAAMSRLAALEWKAEADRIRAGEKPSFKVKRGTSAEDAAAIAEGHAEGAARELADLEAALRDVWPDAAVDAMAQHVADSVDAERRSAPRGKEQAPAARDKTDRTDKTPPAAARASGPVIETFKLADALSDDKYRRAFSHHTHPKRIGTDAAEALGELDNMARRVALFLNDRGKKVADIEKGDNVFQQGYAEMARIIDMAERVVETADKDGNLVGEDGDALIEEFRDFRDDEFEGHNFPINESYTGPRGEDTRLDGDTAPMPPDKIFPPQPDTVNTEKRAGNRKPVPLDVAQKRIAFWKETAERIGREQDNSDKVIISLFDYTGAWAEPWRAAGYRILQHDVKSGSDIITDQWIRDQIEEARAAGAEVYGVLSACPCTTFAGSGARWWADLHDVKSPEAVEKVFGARALASGAKSPVEYNVMLADATKEVVEAAAPTGFHVLENPIGRIQSQAGFPNPTMRFQPHNFGDPYTKRTQLFGDFKADLPLANVDPVEGSKMQAKMRGDNPVDKENRSKTPEGFAYAFFMANDPEARKVKDRTADIGRPATAPKATKPPETLPPAEGDLFSPTTKVATAPVPSSKEIAAAARETDAAPTAAQAEAENYKTGKIQWNGLTLSIENAKGAKRRGMDPETGEVRWEVTMPAHYGRILRTEGADGDHVDFYMGDNPHARTVYVIDQKDADSGKFDEHKLMIGFSDRQSARDTYAAGFSDGRAADRFMSLSAITLDELKAALQTPAVWQTPWSAQPAPGKATPRKAAAPKADTASKPTPPASHAREITRATKMKEAAARLEDKAREERDRPRADDTHRRARMAAGAEADAQRRLNRARILQAIADAVIADPTSPLTTVRSISDIDRLEGELIRARSRRQSQEGMDYGQRKKAEGEPYSEADLAAVEDPYVLVRPLEAAEIAPLIKGRRGIEADARQRIAALADRSRDNFAHAKGQDVAALKSALAVAKKVEPKNYSVKSLAEAITNYDALQRMFGDDRPAFLSAYLDARDIDHTATPDPLKAIRRDLIGNKIPGFFETPQAIAARMVDMAFLKAGERVLEPSAGLGRIATAAAEVVGKDHVDVIEINGKLREALEAQGFNLVADDFTEFDGGPYDAVIMNPPFENRQDAEHVRRAFDLLKPGGRMVAIMGEGVFFGSDAKAVEFRAWLEENDGNAEKLPEGTFKESGTGTNTRLVEITKAEAAASTQAAPEETSDTGAAWDAMTSSKRRAALKEIGLATRADGDLTARNERFVSLSWAELNDANKSALEKRLAPILKERAEDTAARKATTTAVLDEIGPDILNGMASRHKEILGQEPYKFGGYRFTDAIAVGARTGEYSDAFHPDLNPAARQVFEEFTGQKLPKTIKGTKEFLTRGAPFTIESHGPDHFPRHRQPNPQGPADFSSPTPATAPASDTAETDAETSRRIMSETRRTAKEEQAEADRRAAVSPISDIKGGGPVAIAKWGEGATRVNADEKFHGHGYFFLRTGTVPKFDAAIKKILGDTQPDAVYEGMQRIIDTASKARDEISWKYIRNTRAPRTEKWSQASAVGIARGAPGIGDYAVAVDSRLLDFVQKNGLTLRASEDKKVPPAVVNAEGDVVGAVVEIIAPSDAEIAENMRLLEEKTEQPRPAPGEPTEAFNATDWQAARDERIAASKGEGRKHLDDLERSVEAMRGVKFHNVHDPKERGTVRSVANTGEVVVNWADEYSAEKNLVDEKTRDGRKDVAQSWLMPSDLRDYVVDQEKTSAAPARPAARAAPEAEVSVGDVWAYWPNNSDTPTTKSIISTETRNGEEVYLVQIEGERSADIMTAQQVLDQKRIDRANLESRRARDKDEAARVETEKASETARADLDGFDADMTPMGRGRALKVLSAEMRWGWLDGKILSRRDAIRALVADGWTMGTMGSDGEALIRPSDEAYYAAQDLTKTGLSYARHLIAQREGKARGGAEPTTPFRGGEYTAAEINRYIASREEIQTDLRKNQRGATKAQRDNLQQKIDDIDAVIAGAREALGTFETPDDRSPASKIEDFGEKLEGAAKDRWKTYAKKLDDVADDDVADYPLSKSWPEPNYQAMLDEGVDPWAVAFARAAREEVPRKPGSAWKKKRWAAQVVTLRDTVRELLSDDLDIASAKHLLTERMPRLAGRVDLYNEFGHAKSLADLAFTQNTYSVRNGVYQTPALKIWEITSVTKATAWSNMPRVLAEGDTKEAAIAAFREVYETLDTKPKAKPRKGPKFILYRKRVAGDTQTYIGVKRGRDYLDLKAFPDTKEARTFLKENPDALDALLEQKTGIPVERRAENEPRQGTDHRGGADATPEMFTEAFGFRGVQFGNYVEAAKRQVDLNQAYDALMDLSAVLGIPSRALSLNGKLGLAFGARGKGGKGAAAAHYETDTVVINLTKHGGAGSLGHEWWHAFDNYLSRARADNLGFMSERPYVRGEGVRPEVVAAFKSLDEALKRTDVKKRSAELDARRTKDYWTTGREISARSFESYLIEKMKREEQSNDYLANIVDPDVWNAMEAMAGNEAPSYPYIEAAELPGVVDAYDALWSAMQTRETDEGVELFDNTPAGPVFYSPALVFIENARQSRAPAKDWKAIIAKAPGVKKAEIEWLGVEEWLDLQDGQVTREDLARFVRESQIEVVMELGGTFEEPQIRVDVGEAIEPDWESEAEFYIDEAREELEGDIDPEDGDAEVTEAEVQDRAEEMARDRFIPQEYAATAIDLDGDWSADGTFDDTMREYFFDGQSFDSQYDVVAWGEMQAREGQYKGFDFEAHHEEYTEQGGDNYREVLLRMPQLHKQGRNKVTLTPDQRRRWDDVNARHDETRRGTFDQSAYNEVDREREALAREIGMGKEPFAQPGHFEQENIVVHARIKDRIGPNGEKVLFVEEIQSDLASKWREAAESPEISARRRALQAELDRSATEKDALIDRAVPVVSQFLEDSNAPDGVLAYSATAALYDDLEIFHGDGQGTVSSTAAGWAKDALRERDGELYDQIAAIAATRAGLKRSALDLGTEKTLPKTLPDTPFKEERTYQLMVKRLLRMAAEEGYDRLSWTPGFMQAARWDKAAQSVVDDLSWTHRTETQGEHVVDVDLAMADAGGVINLIADRDTGEILYAGNPVFDGKNLRDAVGPSVAATMLKETSGKLPGAKITFPDSGYAIAYDQQIRKAVDTISRKHGARVVSDRSLPDFKGRAIPVVREWVASNNLTIEDVRATLTGAGRAQRNRISPEYFDRLVMRHATMRSIKFGEPGGQKPDLNKVAEDVAAEEAEKFVQNTDGLEVPGEAVWSVDITPELRAAALEPQPILMAASPEAWPKVAEIKGDELGAWSDIRELGRIAGAWYRDNLVGKTVTNKATGWVIHFNNKGSKKIGGRKGQDIYASVVALKELLQNGILIETSADNRGRHTVEYFHKIAGSVTIDGRDVRLIATVRQLPDKTFHYDISRDAGAGRSGTESGLRYLEDTGSALEGTRADINMDPASVIFNREDLRRDITARVNTELERVGIGHKVRARIVPVLMATDAGRFMTVSGSYKTGEIKITPNSAESVMDVLHHEIIHALRDSTLWHRDYGLFEQSEWRALARAARAHPGIMEDIATRYADLSTAAQTEEAVAELYRLWRRGAAVFDMPNSGRVAPILQRVSAFFEALGNALRGLGFVTHGAIFERIAKGEIGARAQFRDAGGRFESAETKFMRDFVETPVKTEAQADARERKFISNLLTQAMSGRTSLLALVPGRPLYAELGRKLPSARTYLRFKEQMDEVRNDWHAQTDKTAKVWGRALRKNSAANKQMMNLMHEATIAGVDPSEKFELLTALSTEDAIWAPEPGDYGYGSDAHLLEVNNQRRKDYDGLREQYDALPPEFQAIFKRVRDDHGRMGAEFEKAIAENAEKAMDLGLDRAKDRYQTALDQIRDDGLTGREKEGALERARADLSMAQKMHGWNKRARLAALRKRFESNKVKQPYFPLMRFGNFFVTLRDAKSGAVVSFSKFESEKKQQAMVKEFENDPTLKVEHGVIGDDSDHRAQVDPNFVVDVEEIIGSVVTDPKVMDEIWQRWLLTMPDYSVRRSRLHRKGTAGYSGDAFRAYGRQMFHGAHQLARLKHAIDLERALDNARKEVAATSDPNRNGLIVDEMKRRHEYVMNPKGSAAAQVATSAAFVYYLGFSPSSALVNISQTTVVGIPIINAAFENTNPVRVAAQLSRALRDFAGGLGWAERSKSLTGEEREALKEAYERGIVDKSQAHDLAGVGETGIEYSSARNRAMEKVSFLFHHAERLNREVTFLASYRLARENGFDHEGAITKGGDLTWKTHFDYQNTSRPRLLQDDWLRVMLVFRNFQINMLWRLFRDSHQMMAGESAAVRREARGQMIGITMSMMLHAGVTGTWGYSLIMMIMSLLGMGKEDEIEQEVKSALIDTLGTDITGMILNGVPGHLTGVDLTSRIGMPELWFRKSDRILEGEDVYAHWLTEFIGAVPNMAQNTFTGVQRILDGEVQRGFEVMLPKFARDLMQAYRYGTEGVQTFTGSDVVADVTVGEALVKAVGFQPARVSERYTINNALINAEKRITARRRKILADVRDDLRSKQAITPKMIKAIEDFNIDNPDFAITGKSIRQSLSSSDRFEAQREGGIRINPRLDQRLRNSVAAPIYD
jgi:protein-L-isoaspartate O-methyltransferase